MREVTERRSGRPLRVPGRRFQPGGRGRARRAWAAAFVVALLAGPPERSSRGQEDGDDPTDAGPETALCLDCHAQFEGEELALGGYRIDLYVDPGTWAGTAHAGQVGCTSCHRDIADYPHRSLEGIDRRGYALNQSESCARCHYAYHTRLLDSTHFDALEAGRRDAPTCTDCHGFHGIARLTQDPLAIDRACARCHADISVVYEQSVHGRTLLEGSAAAGAAADVPVCTDCHGAHEIRDPLTPEFRVAEHQICARCHGDADLMERYGLSPYVLTSYLEDFHGASNELYAQGAGHPTRPMATCTDCHGVHDIHSFRQDGQTEVVRQRVEAICAGCHGEVPSGFGDAWLYHYEPTLASAPLVWAVKWFYRIFIPFILTGLVLHILLHLWHLRRRARA